MVVDFHAQFFTRRFYQYYADEASMPLSEAAVKMEIELPPEDPMALVRLWIDEMDSKGVAKMALISSVPGDGGLIHKAVVQYPGRFVGAFLFDPTTIDAMARIKKGILDLGLKYCCLYPAMHHFHPDDERLSSFFEFVERHNALVSVHCGVLRMPVREKLGLKGIADLRYANPVNLSPVLNASPNLKLVLPHFGGGFFHETLMLGAMHPNVYVDTSSSNSWIKQYPGLTLKEVFDRALTIYGPDRMLFGTDSSGFPRGWRADIFRTQRAILEELGVSHEDQSKIFGGNALRLTGL